MYYVFSFLLGVSFGSFLNVIVCRYPEGGFRSLVGPSSCPRCHKKLGWLELVPIISYCALQAKCSDCKSRISIQYPLVEGLVGASAVFSCWIALSSSPFFGAKFFIFSFLLLGVAVIDIRTWLIPYAFSLSLIFLGTLFAYFELELQIAAFTAIGALLIMSAIDQVFSWYFRKVGRLKEGEQALGVGDAFLLAGIGAFLGYQKLAFVVFFAAFQGLILALVFRCWYGKTFSSGKQAPDGWKPPEGAIPFGPFLALSAVEVALVLGIYI